MKTISLTRGQVALVDDDDFEWLNKWKWYAQYERGTNGFYAARNSSRVNGKRSRIHMHRLIMDARDGYQVDHRNHATLDNQRGNLRLTTGQGNQQNRRLMRHNTSGTCGVHWCKQKRRWRASIMADGKRRHLGYFLTKDNAIAAREAANIAYGFHENHGRVFA